MPFQGKSDELMSELFNLSLRLQMNFLKEICLKHFKDSMSAENCIQRWTISRNMLCEDIGEMAFDFLIQHFDDIASTQAALLLSLDFQDFLTVIQDENLYVGKEDTVWSLIKGWIGVDVEGRKTHLVTLLKQCCLTQIEHTLLTEEIAFDPLVRYNDTAAEMVQEAVKFENHKGYHGNLELKFRSCYCKDQSLVLLLQKESSADDRLPVFINIEQNVHVKAWSDRTESWSSWLAPDKPDQRFACCVHENNLYISGGRKDKTTYRYGGQERKWFKLQDIPVELTGHTMAAVDGCLFVLGGKERFHPNTTVFQYLISSVDTWREEGEILQPVINASSVAYKDKIYLFGGEIEKMPVDCVQVYDTRTKATSIFTLPLPCRWSKVLCRGKYAYLVTNDGNVVKVSLDTETCEIIANIPKFYCKNYGVDIRDGKLYIYGGRNMNALVPFEPTRSVKDIKDSKVDTEKYDIDAEGEEKTLDNDKLDSESSIALVKETDFGTENNTSLISDRIVSVDLTTCEVQELGPLPEPWEVLGCARLVHETDPLD